ncbi:kinase-like protein [Neurospora crassa]|uniref:EKC/KEOPS complex subunit BUD32 n=1 Tax=Neurospora crassa (strain ATCC 24698 / 74-OR23-1A / CBS 708.71 / DSM 1257 / FGSC 987) TaxID=367110 RepID=Q7S326_NEUCR|nr:serine/threonine protein kinase-54 [Neurospora crassa OR74A]EAA29863.1 serine/threonine protein kinase-54 [Neurospora crassa OR74A]KHE84330.1 kinase-like protein [Neurospora crassa]|eukprot:XP_959099.1 serine/threonine protein kinase-54 [Neurospora crassa OR74A]
MEDKKMEVDRETHVITSDPTPPPTAPSPTKNSSSPSIAVFHDCPRECPQEDHVKVGGEAQQDIDDTKSDSSEPEYFDIHDDDMTSPIEALSDYGPGGFHPVHLGDTLGPISDPSRFRVLHKLGHGGFGTVWLCRDTQDGKPKALKILSADASEKAAKACPDFKALQLLTHSVSHEEGLSQCFPHALRAHETAQDLLRKYHIALPYEHFWLPYQPNGSHLCLIAPFLGPNLESFCATYGHVTDLVKHVCFQLVEAMHFLHQKGLCHGDFRPANILFCLNEEVERMGDEELVDALGGVQMAKLTRTPLDKNNKDGAKEEEKEWPKELPRYLVGQADMFKLIRGGWCSPSVAVIDFGVSYPVTEPTGKGTGIPLGYAPPEEAITGKNQEGKEKTLVKLGPKSDVWSLGVTLAELVLDYFPFADSSDKLYGVKNMELVMGPIPEPFRSEFREWYKGIWGPDGTALQDVVMVTDPETGKSVLSPLSFSIKRWKEEKEYAKKESGYEDPIRSRMSLGLETLHTKRSGAAIEAQWARDKTKLPSYTWEQTEEEDEMDDDQFPTKKFDDIEVFSDLLRSIFKWMPEDRVSTAEIMAHPWFKDRYAPSKDTKREGVVSRLSQGTFGIINFMVGFPFKAGNFFFRVFSRVFGNFANPLWFL